MDLLNLIIGLIILVLGAEIIIRGSVSFGRKLNISLSYPPVIVNIKLINCRMQQHNTNMYNYIIKTKTNKNFEIISSITSSSFQIIILSS